MPERSELVTAQFSCGHVVAHTLVTEQQPSFKTIQIIAPHAHMYVGALLCLK